ncbi:hypothetical protein [Prosthecobacter sp.]|uniref:hypothetical protein n=1 Tax=Prosthecobacter sp. TaxID=1965333 RepID=UPI0037843433
MIPFIRPLFLILGLAGFACANDIRVLEITSDAHSLNATVDFLSDESGNMIVKTQATGSQSFDWLDIPDEAKAARIKVGELATLPFKLEAVGTTLVELGAPTVAQNEKGLSVAVLSRTVKGDIPKGARPDDTGWVYFGRISMPPAGAAGLSLDGQRWDSLYLVLPPKALLYAGNAGTKAAVEGNALGKLLRADFPLILRKLDAQGKLARSKDDPIIRAGQYVILNRFKDPDERGNVYAEVKVAPAPGGN